MNVKLTTPNNIFFALALALLVWLSYVFAMGIFANGMEQGRVMCEFETTARLNIQAGKAQAAATAAVYLLNTPNAVHEPRSVTVCVSKAASVPALSNACKMTDEYMVVFPVIRDATGAVTHIGTPTVQ